MPRNAVPPEQKIRRLRKQIYELSTKLQREVELASKAQNQVFTLEHEVQQLRVELRSQRGDLSDAVGVELTVLYNLVKILDETAPDRRHRLLAMIDARYYDPPAKPQNSSVDGSWGVGTPMGRSR